MMQQDHGREAFLALLREAAAQAEALLLVRTALPAGWLAALKEESSPFLKKRTKKLLLASSG